MHLGSAGSGLGTGGLVDDGQVSTIFELVDEVGVSCDAVGMLSYIVL